MNTKNLVKNNLVQGKMIVKYSENLSVSLIVLDENFGDVEKEITVNSVLLKVVETDSYGNKETTINQVVIGFGSSKTGVGVMSDDPTLFGKLLTIENFESCKLVFEGSLDS